MAKRFLFRALLLCSVIIMASFTIGAARSVHATSSPQIIAQNGLTYLPLTKFLENSGYDVSMSKQKISSTGGKIIEYTYAACLNGVEIGELSIGVCNNEIVTTMFDRAFSNIQAASLKLYNGILYYLNFEGSESGAQLGAAF